MQRYESYKPSGVSWMGSIPADWEIKKFRYAYTQSNAGEVIDKSHWHFGDELLFTCQKTPMQSGYPKFDNRKRTRCNDLLLTRNGTPYVHLPPEGAIYSNVVQRVRLPDTFNRRFVWYALSNSCLHLSGYGDIIESFNMSTWNNLAFPVPPRPTQDRIVAFIDQKTAEIDAAIAKKERLIELLGEQKKTLINQAVTRGLNESALMKESGVAWLGKVPAHWNLLPNKALFGERKELGQPELPILSVSLHTGVSDQEQDETENVRAKVRIEDKTSYKRVFPGDVAYNMMRAWQGAIGVVRVDGLVSPAYVVAAPRSKIYGTYFEHLYRTDGFIKEMDRFSKGITDFRKRLYWDEFKQLMTLLPPLPEQIQIAEHAERIVQKTFKACESVLAEIEKLQELRRVIVAQVVTGQVKI